MGNAPINQKRRISGELDFRLSSVAPNYVAIPPLKRRNMYSLTDLSRSAPADGLLSDDCGDATPFAVAPSEDPSIDDATKRLHDASLMDTSLSSSRPRPASTGLPSPVLDFEGIPRELAPPESPDGVGILTSAPELTGIPPVCEQDDGGPPIDHTQPPICPTVFRWNGGGNEIYVSGTFNNWAKRVPMVRRKSGVYVIVDCPPGVHEYKYFIDGAWYHDPTKPTVENSLGTKNNVVEVRSSDLDFRYALQSDLEHSKRRSSTTAESESDSGRTTPPGEYGHIIPSYTDHSRRYDGFRSRTIPAAPGLGSSIQPPLLPPHLLHGILNMDTGVHCDPNLLPSPSHVIVNHLYALSIKDGVIVLSVITRFRHKYVSTVFYRPI